MLNEAIKNLSSGSYIFVVDKNIDANDICEKIFSSLSVREQDILKIDPENGSIKIKQIRSVKEKLSLKPEGNFALIILSDADTITPEAANAMLKILEDTPRSAIIILFTRNQKRLLPTILSRCKKIIVREKRGNEFDAKYVEILEAIRGSKYIFQKFKIAEDVVKEEMDNKKMLEHWIVYLRSNLTEESIKDIKTINLFYKKYKPGINKKLFLDNLFIKLKQS